MQEGKSTLIEKSIFAMHPDFRKEFNHKTRTRTQKAARKSMCSFTAPQFLHTTRSPSRLFCHNLPLNRQSYKLETVNFITEHESCIPSFPPLGNPIFHSKSAQFVNIAMPNPNTYYAQINEMYDKV
jgi:hypothetical protein